MGTRGSWLNDLAARQLSMSRTFDFPSSWDPQDPRLSLRSLYGFSCLSYALLALVVSTVFRGSYDCEPRTFPPVYIGVILMCGQSVASVFGDIVHCSRPSRWHTMDRMLALGNVLCGMSNMLWASLTESLLCFSIVTSGVAVLTESRNALDAASLSRFTFWHSLWHWWIPCWYSLWLCFRPGWYGCH
eukprot:TRINITY_DN18102_c0_g1_i1.p2 TRINITY_DN18102_c0_g1~~TRINITY_DN18102_c0_g1_i1.p2  ORF type:complete len:187 (+),score=10.83 TRINITY_DN18102_c0_g1_i1:218-778(+)